MQNLELFLKALKTMLYSGGGDIPHEAELAFWEFVEWYEREYSTVIPHFNGEAPEQISRTLEYLEQANQFLL